MPAIQRTTLIRAEPGAVFDLISRVEDFSRYARMISSIRAVAPDTFRWNVSVAGLELEWDAVVTEARRPYRFSWQSIRGIENGGSFELRAVPGGTEVNLDMHYRLPNPLIEKAVNTLAAPLMQKVAGEILEHVRRRLEHSTDTN